ncbi:TetR family transcriptional regulator [Cellulomonas sp. KRMCY2]|uniref:TetR/AcrR family transcriptional regulator n=1 Tax=Cellulomonas sp. KRMCY2 TaxID=1304865 RepID=UPI00045E8C0D|nr:TetR family transcriptional regulator [Cellulomonas sp. KRMCY2]
MGEQRQRGRRAGGARARAEIVAAARVEFAERGYDAASVRGIARTAGVDPALVRYYFPGGKPEVFAVAVADRPTDPSQVVAGLLAGGIDGLGERLVASVLDIWDAPGGREQFRIVFGAAAAGQDTLVRDFLVREVFVRVAAAMPGPDAPLRVSLVASQVAGLLVARYVLEVEPIASADAAELVRRVGPVLQHYLEPSG